MDAYELINVLRRLWPEHAPKNSGELSKSKKSMDMYARTPNGVYKLKKAYFDPEFGIMLDTEEKTNGKETI